MLAGSVRVDRVDDVLLESRVEAGERDQAVVAPRPRRSRARAQDDERCRGNRKYQELPHDDSPFDRRIARSSEARVSAWYRAGAVLQLLLQRAPRSTTPYSPWNTLQPSFGEKYSDQTQLPNTAIGPVRVSSSASR